MSAAKNLDNPMFLYWPDISKAAKVYVFKTKRKTTEISMTHTMEIILRVPLCTSIEDIQNLIGKHANNFKHHALITALRKNAE